LIEVDLFEDEKEPWKPGDDPELLAIKAKMMKQQAEWRKPKEDKETRPRHIAGPIENGRVSPLCAKVWRPIDLEKECWTLLYDSVTCVECQKVLQEQNHKHDL